MKLKNKSNFLISERGQLFFCFTDLECYCIDKAVFQTLVTACPVIADQIAEVLAARREALESARGQRAATSRAEVKADLVDRIRGFFGLRG